jgi:tRNA threonylcarbamoyladenosine biosynthesis protein TsaB
MKLLAIDTATEACSAVVWIDGAAHGRYEVIGRGHAERLLPMVDELLAETGLVLSNLDAIAFGRGPGAFTGVRIAVGLAQGLAFGAELPVVPVSNLAALARLALDRDAAEVPAGASTPGASRACAALVCLDARMNEVYWAEARGREDGGIDLAAERLGSPDAVALSSVAPAGVAPASAAVPRLIAAGHGWSAYPRLRERFPGLAACWPDLLPRAYEVATLAALEVAAGRAVPAEEAAPVYLRDDVATRSGRAGAPGR